MWAGAKFRKSHPRFSAGWWGEGELKSHEFKLNKKAKPHFSNMILGDSALFSAQHERESIEAWERTPSNEQLLTLNP